MTAIPHHPFRFGVANFGFTNGAEFSTIAHRSENLGYSTFGFSDHMGNFAPFTGMAAAAQATSRLRVGCLLANDFWNPAILAREALAIDLVSNGRLELGLGSGFFSGDYKQTGIPLDAPGVRISRLEESVCILKGLLSGETVSFSGKYYHIDQLSLPPKPVQQPHPPILIGGGSRRILSLAARQADIVSFNIRTTPEGWFDTNSVSLKATQEKVGWVCQAAGERLPDLEFSIVAQIVITGDREGAARQIVENWKSMGVEYTMEMVLESPAFLLGDVERLVDLFQQNRELFGFSYYTIVADELEDFAPIVQRLAGR